MNESPTKENLLEYSISNFMNTYIWNLFWSFTSPGTFKIQWKKICYNILWVILWIKDMYIESYFEALILPELLKYNN